MSDSEDDHPCRPMMIPCLMGIGQLQRAAESIGAQLGDSTRKYLVLLLLKKLGPRHVQRLISKFVEKGLISWEDDLYEVDFIMDHCEDESGEIYYLIKWEGWGDSHNSWEPRSNLQCDKIIQEYMAQSDKEGKCGVKRKYKDIAKLAGPPSKSVLVDELFDKLSCSNKVTNMTPMDIYNLYSPAKKVKTIKPLIGGMQSGGASKLRPKFKRKNLSKKKIKEDVQQALKDWESQLNETVKDVDSAPIRVINDVDLEGPPDTFIYINHCKAGPGVTIPNDPLVGCECEDCYSSKKECCAACSGAEFAYYKKQGKIRLPPGRPVYECNNRCKCGPDCANRVVQKGRRYKVSIFRTRNGRGWGVKALQPIKKGSFVMEYVGEVITHEEAERRGKEYDAAGRTYLFDLDFADSTAFTVDAGVYGNAAHFINHSCDPNMEVYCVWVNNLDPRMPHICLFAKRDIQKDEELSFDYLCARPGPDEGDSVKNSSATTKTPAPVLSSDIGTQTPALPEIDGGLTSENGDNVAIGETGDSPKDKSSSSSSSSSTAPNSYSCICQCGAANCRIYLF